MKENGLENSCRLESFNVELSLQEFTDILNTGFEDRVTRAMVKNLITWRIIHPRKDSRTFKQTLTAKDILRAYVAVELKKESGYEQWDFVATLMRGETLKNGEDARTSPGWLRVATAALMNKDIDFDDYPELAPIIKDVEIPTCNITGRTEREIRSSNDYFKKAWLLKREGIKIHQYRKLTPIFT